MMSHPGYIPAPSWGTSLLRSMGNEARFAVLSLPNGTVYSNTAKTIEKLNRKACKPIQKKTNKPYAAPVPYYNK